MTEDDDLTIPLEVLPAEIVRSNVDAERGRNFHPPEKSRAATQTRYRMICHMSVLGYRNGAIAEQMGCTNTTVSRVLNSNEGRELIAEISRDLFVTEPQAMFRARAPRASAVVEEIMENPDEKGSTRLAAAEVILDRAYGKPTQPTEDRTGSVVRELYAALEEEKKVARATFVAASVANPPEEAENDAAGVEALSPTDVTEDKSGFTTPVPPPAPTPLHHAKTAVDSTKISNPEDVDAWVAENL